jgi:hypothetical protein
MTAAALAAFPGGKRRHLGSFGYLKSIESFWLAVRLRAAPTQYRRAPIGNSTGAARLADDAIE